MALKEKSEKALARGRINEYLRPPTAVTSTVLQQNQVRTIYRSGAERRAARVRFELLFHLPPILQTKRPLASWRRCLEAAAPARPGDEPPSSNSSEAKARVCGRSEVQSATPEGQMRMAGSIVGVVKSGRWRAAKLNKDEKDTPAHQRCGKITFAVPLLSSAAFSARFVPCEDLPRRQDNPPNMDSHHQRGAWFERRVSTHPRELF